MTPQERAVLPELLRRNNFGVDYQVDADGEPIEQGIGAPGHETMNHFNAMRGREGKPGGEEPGTTDRLMAEWKARKSGVVPVAKSYLAPGHRSADPPALKTKHRGNPQGLIKARAAAKAKREAAHPVA